MARRKKKTSGRTAMLGSAVSALGGLPAGSLKHTAAAVWVLLVGGLVVAWMLGVPHLQAYVSSERQPQQVSVRFVDPPAWMNGDLEAHLELVAREQIAADPLRREGLVAARRALLDTGWFDEIRQVRRAALDDVRIEATFVDPYAVVRDLDGDHLVDPSGRLLPRSVPVGQATRFTVIEGVHYRRPPRPGMQWQGADVTAALRLLRLITQRPWREQVAAIDVSQYDADQRLQLITDRGYRITWGRPPGEERYGEATTKAKLMHLDFPYEHFGHIDGGHQGNLDISSTIGVIVE